MFQELSKFYSAVLFKRNPFKKFQQYFLSSNTCWAFHCKKKSFCFNLYLSSVFSSECLACRESWTSRGWNRELEINRNNHDGKKHQWKHCKTSEQWEFLAAMGCSFVALLFYPWRPGKCLSFKSPGPLGVIQILKVLVCYCQTLKYFDYSAAASELLSGELCIHPPIYDHITLTCRCSSPKTSGRAVVYYLTMVYT